MDCRRLPPCPGFARDRTNPHNCTSWVNCDHANRPFRQRDVNDDYPRDPVKDMWGCDGNVDCFDLRYVENDIPAKGMTMGELIEYFKAHHAKY